jgi:predicted alpha/beta hydrolase
MRDWFPYRQTHMQEIKAVHVTEKKSNKRKGDIAHMNYLRESELAYVVG